MAKLELVDLGADVIADFLDHTEADRSNAIATRNCRRAALRSFIKHLLRNDLDHSLQHTGRAGYTSFGLASPVVHHTY